jgi:hypothetical protein
MAVLEQFFPYRWYIVGALLVAYALGQYRQWQRLRAFKGPLIASLSSLWLPWAITTKECHLKFAKANEQYGPLARIGPNLLITSDPELLIRMNSGMHNQ